VEKHRDEKEFYAISFDEYRLATDETLTGTPTVKVRKRTSSGWEDKTDEFGTLDVTLGDSSTDVEFTLNAASEGEQLPGIYLVYCEVGTSQSRTIVATKWLTVLGRGSAT
jgi:hypothetical protein